MNMFLVSFLGAFIQEVLHWVDLKQELGGAVQLTKSKDYWIITIIATAVFTLATPFIVEEFIDTEELKNWHYLVTAFAFPSVLRKLVKVLLKSDGNAENPAVLERPRFKMREYFKIS